MNSIIEGLPAQRQSLLFSATQTRLELQLGLVRVRSIIVSGLGLVRARSMIGSGLGLGLVRVRSMIGSGLG